MTTSLDRPKLYPEGSLNNSTFLNTANVSWLLQVPQSRLRTWRSRLLGPTFIRMLDGKRSRILYRPADVIAFIEASVVLTERMPKPGPGRMPRAGAKNGRM